MAVPPPTKDDVRKLLKARRDAYVASRADTVRVAACQALAARVLPRLQPRATVSAYWPIGSEIDTACLLEGLHKAGHRLALPHVTSRTAPLRFLAWSPADPLIEGPFGLHQPMSDTPEVAPDVILAPLLGFDRMLNRIGYGAGHYDRAFAAHPHARRIGLAWKVQQCEAIPVDSWDVPLHAVATEEDWIGA